MSTNNRIVILATATLLTLAGAPAFAQGYGSAASVAASLGATASPPLARGPFLVPAEPSIARLPQDRVATRAILQHAPHIRMHHR